MKEQEHTSKKQAEARPGNQAPSVVCGLRECACLV